MKAAADRIEMLVNKVPPLMQGISETTFADKPAPNKWSKKEILGHLIDSASNNHHRFVRGQFEPEPHIQYDQEQWVKCSHYQSMSSHLLISFWSDYNRLLVEIIRNIPREMLQRKVNSGDPKSHSIQFLIEDYVRHMEHHLKQIVHY